MIIELSDRDSCGASYGRTHHPLDTDLYLSLQMRCRGSVIIISILPEGCLFSFFSLYSFFFFRDALGVYQLASLLMELDPSDEASRILCADALYQMGWVEEAHKLLSLALSRNPQRSPVLARLALLQLKKGFMYDGNQVGSAWLQLSNDGMVNVASKFCLKPWKRFPQVDSPIKYY